jgi:hypothetical protein
VDNFAWWLKADYLTDISGILNDVEEHHRGKNKRQAQYFHFKGKLKCRPT